MADKAATIYIIDVGQSMGEKNNGREQTDLEFALQYVFDKITTTISNGRKTDMIGTIAMRTDGRLLFCDLMGLRGTLSDVVGVVELHRVHQPPKGFPRIFRTSSDFVALY